MKSFSKSKFSLCFRPVADLDDMLESKVAAHHSKNKRTVLKVIKAMALETILNRRARHQNCYGLDCFGVSKNNYSTYNKKVTKTTQSSLSNLSSDSSNVSQSKTMSTKVKHDQQGSRGSTLQEKQKKFELHAMCLVLISLAFTVFFGKNFGVILTSILLYFFSLLLYGPRYSVVYSPKYMDVKGRYRK